nr:ubiquinone biosynthesis o-methyltransferase, mitochondrial [Quercus suber]
MASKLVRLSHLRALSSSINNHIRSPHFSNPNQAPLSYRLFSNASSSSSSSSSSSRPDKPTGGFQRASSLRDLELAKFTSIAETWWDSKGPFKPLHVMNPTRLAFIRSTLCRHFSFSELDFWTEKLVEEDRKFDAVIALEVIEHVANPAEFCKSLAALTVPDGATIISTINRSMRSYATAIVAAEYLLHWLPKGTHEWSSFLTPEELVLILQRANITVREMAGFVYNPLTGRWSLSDDISVNFIAFGTKNCQ